MGSTHRLKIIGIAALSHELNAAVNQLYSGESGIDVLDFLALNTLVMLDPVTNSPIRPNPFSMG
jgi:hypothetical protein